jgi:DNA primase
MTMPALSRYQQAPLNKPDILSIMEREGIELRQRGRDLWAPCPFHTEKTPSFKVSPERQSFYCFSCNEHGDVIDFIQKLHGVSFRDALTTLGIIPGKLLPVDPEKERQRRLLQDFRQWTRRRLAELSREIRQCRAIIDMGGPDRLHVTADFVEDMQAAEMQIEVLQNGSDEEKYELWGAQ